MESKGINMIPETKLNAIKSLRGNLSTGYLRELPSSDLLFYNSKNLKNFRIAY